MTGYGPPNVYDPTHPSDSEPTQPSKTRYLQRYLFSNPEVRQLLQGIGRIAR